ncbi:hypothetical protein GALMADRAFT_160381 [Galerina marginata CBS 339.88]|uniref:Uncharacterized protein n=1 Tax=Galerina marginata (strain CBS 339.88) TaxID=685588 RepID=A0A067SFC1_GALM3|nr:hypothetical protein GALMADRAFT_160381 [Galerina marginata CBS 339.88]
MSLARGLMLARVGAAVSAAAGPGAPRAQLRATWSWSHGHGGFCIQVHLPAPWSCSWSCCACSSQGQVRMNTVWLKLKFEPELVPLPLADPAYRLPSSVPACSQRAGAVGLSFLSSKSTVASSTSNSLKPNLTYKNRE